MSLEISRSCTIDMGHRVTNHNSKCKNIHGHTYKIEIFAQGPLVSEGSSEGMVVDYSYLKDLLAEIDDIFDHGFCMWVEDKALIDLHFKDWEDFEEIKEEIKAKYVSYKVFPEVLPFGKVVVVTTVPTAENLASLWLQIMSNKLLEDKRSDKTLRNLKLTRIKVWETPNSCCEVRI